MKDTFIAYSAECADQPIRNIAYSDREVTQPTQRHVVICDAETGDVHIATATTNKPESMKWPDVSIKGPFDKANLVYFEYSTGKNNEISTRINKLSDDKKERVKQAHLRHYGHAL